VSRLANRLAGRAFHVSAERSTDRRRSPAVRRLNRLTVRWTDVVLAVSPTVRDLLVARDRLPAAKVRVLENGIDLAAVDACHAARLRHELPGLRSGALLFCSVGRFVPEKGFVHLVRAFARMRERARAQLLLVGEGPEEAVVRSEVLRCGLDGEVLQLGFRPDVLAVLKATDAFVLSSVEEGSPMALLEAMACGLPAVATEVSGVRSLVGPDGPECAALVVAPPEDWTAHAGRRGQSVTAAPEERVVALAQAMDRLADDAPLRQALGQRARRRVEAEYALEQVVIRLETLYRSAVGSAAGVSADAAGGGDHGEGGLQLERGGGALERSVERRR
jgi:glycosyltransferase involved in cell wall biosynthesis